MTGRGIANAPSAVLFDSVSLVSRYPVTDVSVRLSLRSYSIFEVRDQPSIVVTKGVTLVNSSKSEASATSIDVLAQPAPVGVIAV